MKIRSHSESHIVELDDGSRWQIFPGDIDLTSNWKPETELVVIPIEDEVSSHTLLVDFLPTERNAMFDRIATHLETLAQTGEVPVVEHQIRYDDGAGYERYMGSWSRLAGEVFLDWLAPRPGLRWIDIGCGNGAFTELLVQRCAPAEIRGIDPSEAQLAFARARPAARGAAFHQGDAMALPFP